LALDGMAMIEPLVWVGAEVQIGSTPTCTGRW
jgi:hypothetical protein